MNHFQDDFDNADEAGAADGVNDVQWLAFGYVAGELTAEQSAAFEQRLANDLEAQVALSEVVSLTSATHKSLASMADVKVERSQRPVVEAKGSFRRPWMAAVAAAAAGFFILVSAWQYLPGNTAQHAVAGDELELWGRSVEIHQRAELINDGYLYAQDESEFVDEAEEMADALSVDGDLALIFASAFSLSDESKVDM